MKDANKAVTAGVISTVPGISVLNVGKQRGEAVNIGVIGTGGRGNWLIKLLGEIPSARVMACCDIIPARLEKGLSLSSEESEGYNDYRDLLENKDVDAVIISAPLSLHYDMAKDAITAGKHVYCEKTMCFKADEAISLGAVLKDTDLVFQVGYQHRYNPMYQQIKNMITNEDFGELVHIECYWNRNGDWRRPVEDPKWERTINWRMYREYSGGLMAELSSHQLDIVNWILEDVPQSVNGYGGIDFWKDGRETFDHVHSTFRYKSGIQASYTCLTTNAHMGYQMLFYGKNATIQVKGEQGHKAYLYIEPSWMADQKKPEDVDSVSGATLQVFEAGKAIPILGEGGPESDAEPTGKALESFVRCIRNGERPLSNYENGKTSSICIDMANEAMYEGREAKILIS